MNDDMDASADMDASVPNTLGSAKLQSKAGLPCRLTVTPTSNDTGGYLDFFDIVFESC